MKGIIRRKINSKPPQSERLDMLLNSDTNIWEVEYDHLLPHAGISKKGTGPGVGKKIYTTERIPLHPQDIYNSDGTLFAEDGKEIEFEIDHMTPMGMVFGQEQYAGTMQQSYGIGARIIAHHSVTWDDVRDFMLSDDGLGDTKANKSFEWIIEEFKKGNYEIPQKVLSEIINKKNEGVPFFSSHKAPFTEEEIKKFNEHQKNIMYHPYTCCSTDSDGNHCERSKNNWGILIATRDGLVCPCGKYKQDWFH